MQGAPDAMCVLASNRQLQDVVKFCCDSQLFSIFGVDPTFNLGEFSVTVTTYRHLQLLDRNTRKPPVKKTAQSYHFLASSMVGLCPDLASIQGFGTDGEKPIGDGFKLQFRNASHLLCFIHVKDCIVRKLREIGICGASMQPFLNDIFGKQDSTHLFTGLVDCDSTSMFDEQLLNLEAEWNSKECSIRSSTSPEFFDWFTKYQSVNFKAHMLKPLRVKAIHK